MEYIDLVERIVAAEHQASALAREAKEKEASLETDLARESTELHDRYMERARRRISLVEAEEAQRAEKAIAALDQRLSRSMAALERAYETDRDAWVEALFTKITGGTP